MAQSEAFIVELNSKPEYQRILEGKPKTCGMRSGRVFLEPGNACGQHSTKEHEELLVFLAGHGELQIGDPAQHVAPLSVGAGRVAYIPPKTLHDVRNTGDAPLVYIYCVAPADAG
jgi:oxalate decarboxylase/phosphoglucose isomerase-like protein (cupin superfamily)